MVSEFIVVLVVVNERFKGSFTAEGQTLPLFEAARVEVTPPPPAPPKQTIERTMPVRKPVHSLLGASLPRKDVLLHPSPIPYGMVQIGLEVTAALDYVPGRLQVQAKRFVREGVNLSDSTLNGWLGECSELLEEIDACLGTEVMESGYIQADEATIAVQERIFHCWPVRSCR